MKSLDELAQIRDEYRKLVSVRESNEDNIKISISMDDCGIAAGAREILKVLMNEIVSKKLNNIIIYQTKCSGLCEQEPIMQVDFPGRDRVIYGKVNTEGVMQIINRHLINGKVVDELLIN